MFCGRSYLNHSSNYVVSSLQESFGYPCALGLTTLKFVPLLIEPGHSKDTPLCSFNGFGDFAVRIVLKQGKAIRGRHKCFEEDLGKQYIHLVSAVENCLSQGKKPGDPFVSLTQLHGNLGY